MVVLPEDTDRPRGILSASDREALLAGREEWEKTHSRSAYTQRERAIRERTREALRDFRLLAHELPAEEREKIFGPIKSSPRTEEYQELRGDVQAVIEFLYAGMGGQSEFRQPLVNGVRNGENALGNVEHSLDISPRFTVDKLYQTEVRDATALVEAKEWNRLHPPDLFSFVRFAHDADALDFDAIRDEIDFVEQPPRTGYKRRTIPGGKQTPLMDPDLFEREGMGTMSREELHALFGEGYSNSIRHVVYDGEKVIRYPGPWSDDDPEVIDWMGNEPTDVE